MLALPNMVMIGGNSRNSGKTTMACQIINKLSLSHEVFGLKVSAIYPEGNEMHGNHSGEESSGFSISEEINSGSNKDTSKMLRAGATRVFYIRVSSNFIEKALLHFLSMYINNQIIVCESRSLRKIITPGMFLLMMRLPAEGKIKDVTVYYKLADKVFNFNENQEDKVNFVARLQFEGDKFVY